MKQKTSITLSEDLLAEIDRRAGPDGSRSAIIEALLRKHFRAEKVARQHARDLARLNRAAAGLNLEAEDVLAYQALD